MRARVRDGRVAAMTTTAPDRLRLDGLTATIQADTASTAGRYLLLDCEGRQGDRVPTHVHTREDEWVLVLDGELAVTLDGTELTVRPAEPIVLPKRVPHALEVRSPDTRFLSLWDPPGLEAVLRALSEETPGAAPLDPDDVDALLAAAGITLL
jgi:quercetin dioxygenase-like cupin family protein